MIILIHLIHNIITLVSFLGVFTNSIGIAAMIDQDLWVMKIPVPACAADDLPRPILKRRRNCQHGEVQMGPKHGDTMGRQRFL